MTSHTLHITFDDQEGGMLRIMGLIHRRGFEVTGIDMPVAEGKIRTASVTMTPKGAFRIEVLQKQIARLLEVKDVKVVEALKRRNILNFFRSRSVAGVHDSIGAQ